MARALRTFRPGGEATDDGAYRWVEQTDVQADAIFQTVARMSAEGNGTKLRLDVTYDARVPYFWWVFDGLIRRSVLVTLGHGVRAVEALVRGNPVPGEPKRPWWAPPSAMTSDQIRVIATLSLVLALAQYGGSLLTQTVDYVAGTYGATNAQLGVVTAATRAGVLIALVGGILADRIGRRRLLLWSLGAVSLVTAVTAVAPNLAAFGGLQLIVRGAVNLAFAVAFIAAVEEAPEGSRTYTIAIVGIASGLGFVAGVVLLPMADLAGDAWRLMYVIGIVGLVFLPGISRNLTETKRFEALVARNAPRGRLREVVDRRYGGRFLMLCFAGFLINVFFAPQSQFTNRYLGDERGFSGFDILILRAVTQGIPAFAAAYAGGRLAESVGRRPVAVRGLIVASLAFAVFFSYGGPALWVTLAIATAAEALSGPALSAFGTELFPTEVRGTAGAGLTVAAVLGSAAGLIAVGYLADPFDSVGKAAAVTAVAPLIVAIFLIRRLPEARGMLLDDVSPPEV